VDERLDFSIFFEWVDCLEKVSTASGWASGLIEATGTMQADPAMRRMTECENPQHEPESKRADQHKQPLLHGEGGWTEEVHRAATTTFQDFRM
jgi:hypothetical protein